MASWMAPLCAPSGRTSYDEKPLYIFPCQNWWEKASMWLIVAVIGHAKSPRFRQPFTLTRVDHEMELVGVFRPWRYAAVGNGTTWPSWTNEAAGRVSRRDVVQSAELVIRSPLPPVRERLHVGNDVGIGEPFVLHSHGNLR
jgi:hypothetical protein